jgi:hypothetical protein
MEPIIDATEGRKAAHRKEEMKSTMSDDLCRTREHGTDRPQIVDWTRLCGGL